MEKKEGDIVTFTLHGREIRLLCKGDNTPSIGGYGGRFEEFFERYTSRSDNDNILPPEEFIPPLSEEKQREMLQQLHDAYVKSIRQK
jgi:hypothetical protein